MSVAVDKFKRKTKLFLQIITLISVLIYVVLVCIQERYITISVHAVLRKSNQLASKQKVIVSLYFHHFCLWQ